MTLTPTQYRDLKKFERHFLTATRANYVTAIYKTTAEEVTRLYNEIYKTNKKPSTCNKCVLDMFKRLGTLYFAYVEPTQSDEHEPDGQPTETTDETPTEGEKTIVEGVVLAALQELTETEYTATEPAPKPKRKYNRKKKTTK